MSGGLATIKAVAESWEAVCRSTDTDRILSHISEEGTIWYNFDPVDHGRAAYRGILDTSKQSFRNQIYKDVRVHLHSGGFVEQATLVGETDAGVVETPFLLIATVQGDRITRIEEYFDTTIMKSLG